MKKNILLVMALTFFTLSRAQTSFGPGGLTIKANTPVSIDSLVLKPTADMTISNNQLQVRYTPVTFSSGNSVLRVYEWDNAMQLTGEAGLFVAPEELNNNALPLLQIAYSNSTGNSGFTISTGSIVEESINYVENTFTATSIKQLTAVNPANSTLPVQWLSFTAEKAGPAALLIWKVAQEENVNQYEVLKSANGTAFESIGTAAAQCNGCGSTETIYTFTDLQPFSGNNFYRIKETDIDGQVSYSIVRQLNFGNETDELKVNPNPAATTVYISNLVHSKEYIISVTAMNGSIVKYEQVRDKTNHQIDVSALANGQYVLTVTGDGMQFTKKIVVAR